MFKREIKGTRGSIVFPTWKKVLGLVLGYVQTHEFPPTSNVDYAFSHFLLCLLSPVYLPPTLNLANKNSR